MKRNEDPQIGADDNGEWEPAEWEELIKIDRLLFAGAIILFVFGALSWGGFL